MEGPCVVVSPRSLAIELALEAGRLLRERLGHVQAIRYKGEINLVTDVDLASERLILRRIREAFPEHAILSEEQPTSAEVLRAPYTWVVDPLDGTTNFAHGYPMFAVSIAWLCEGEPYIGVVYQPVLDELFLAERGHGAYLNGQRLHVSSEHVLRRSLLATGFPYDAERRRQAVRDFVHFIDVARAIRRDGTAAIDLCYVAAGRFDGFWERELSPWDTAAGVLLVREAGGMVTNEAGEPYRLGDLVCVASNGQIHQEMLAVLAAVQHQQDPDND